jgi:hypothetical protein
MQTALADMFVFLAKLTWWVALAGAVVFNAIALFSRGGMLDMLGGLILLPLTLVAVPFYAIIAAGDWRPLVFTFLLPVVGLGLWLFGRALRASAQGE